MITFVLVFIAAFFNAVMDRVENENFSSSVFKNLNARFWYKRVSWQFAGKIFGYKIDAWHLAKSFMLLALFAAVVVYKEQFGLLQDIGIMGIAWISGFNLFYSKLLKK